MLSYGDKQHYVRPGEPFVIREEKASVLKRLVFEAGPPTCLVVRA
jgi:hypothetical protein